MRASRRGIHVSAFAAGVSFSNVAVVLPLLVLARGGSPVEAGALIALETIAFSLGALLPTSFGRAVATIALALAALVVGDLVMLVAPGPALLAAGALIHGSGMGLFWVGVQASLGRRSGAWGSERAFVAQYTLYVVGTASGGALTGAAVAGLTALGVEHVLGIRLAFLVGAVAVTAAGPTVRTWLRAPDPAPSTRRSVPGPLYGLRLQLPDLFLVAAMGTLLGLAPVVLRTSFHLTALPIGCVAGGVAAAKIGGSFTASRIAATRDRARVVGGMLAAAALAAGLLLAAHTAWLYVALMITAAFLAVGVWPTLVDGALARVTPAERGSLAVIWNVREYGAAALTTIGGSLLLHTAGTPDLLTGLVTLLLIGAALTALAGLRAPVHEPEPDTIRSVPESVY